MGVGRRRYHYSCGLRTIFKVPIGAIVGVHGSDCAASRELRHTLTAEVKLVDPVFVSIVWMQDKNALAGCCSREGELRP